MSYFSSNLKFLRNGRRQEDCAARIGVTGSCWSNYETNVSRPRLPVMLKISKFFNIPVAELLETDLRSGSLQSSKEQPSNELPVHILNDPPVHYRVIIQDFDRRLSELEKTLKRLEEDGSSTKEP